MKRTQVLEKRTGTAGCGEPGGRTSSRPTVLVLDGDFDSAIHVATELHEDLDASVIGVGTSDRSRLLRSRYCERGLTAPAPGTDGYASAIREAVEQVRPDVVVPIGYDSTAALVSLQDGFPQCVEVCLPSARSFAIAEDKRRTLALAERTGIPVPDDYTERVRTADRQGRRSEVTGVLDYPVFLKAQRETGSPHTAVVEDPSEFWSEYDRLRSASGEELLVQKHVEGDDHTYACGLLFVNGSLQLLVGHEEVRSVPRRGGSGTRLRLFRHPRLEALSIQLLRRLDWNGVALVEFKRRSDGTFVLMEINPKFWASYALASQCGYRFASTIAALSLGLSTVPRGRAEQTGERVFPLRELYYWLNHPAEESLSECLGAMLWPPAHPDLNLTDLRSFLTLPDEYRRDADDD